jgi:preprotein translocase SecE subunit
VARDRKRAKQRRDRRGTRATRRSSQAADTTREGAEATPPRAPEDGGPAAADVPGALEHASADADEFEAALVRGAGGSAAEPTAEPAAEPQAPPGDGLAAADQPAAGDERAPDGEAAAGEERLRAGADLELAQAGLEPGTARGRDREAAGGDGPGALAPARPAGAPRGGGRAVAFLQASWAELQRVQWPDRRQTTQATAVVLGFVVVAGLYLGAADVVAKEIVDLVLG